MRKTKMKQSPMVSSFGRYKNYRGIISTPSFRKNSNVAIVMIYGKQYSLHVLVCHTFNGKPPSEAEQEVLHLNQFPDFRPDSYMHAKARFLKFGTHSQNMIQSYQENTTRRSNASQLSIPILGKKVGEDDDQWVKYAGVSEAARIIGETHSVVIQISNISAVVNGKRTQTSGFVFKRAQVEVLKGEVWEPSQDGTSVSNMQRFKNAEGHIYVPILNSGQNYVKVKIGEKGLYFHRLVCEAFKGREPSAEHTVDHIDGNPLNNTPENLRWATRKEQRANQPKGDERKSSAPKRSKPILGREVREKDDAAAWIPFASASDAARRWGLNPGSVSAVVNGRCKTVGNVTTGKRYEFMPDKDAAEPEILVDDDGNVEEWRPVKMWKFVDGTWVDIFADLTEQTRNSELINPNPILTFKDDCIKEIEGSNRGSNRVGVKKVMEAFNTWCKKNSVREYKKLKDFRENFEKITGLKRSSTRGYKIELNL